MISGCPWVRSGPRAPLHDAGREQEWLTMTDPEVRDIIADALEPFAGDYSSFDLANVVVGALANGGYAIVQVDADVLRRVFVEMAKEKESKR